jgi:hypothetical protein
MPASKPERYPADGPDNNVVSNCMVGDEGRDSVSQAGTSKIRQKVRVSEPVTRKIMRDAWKPQATGIADMTMTIGM